MTIARCCPEQQFAKHLDASSVSESQQKEKFPLLMLSFSLVDIEAIVHARMMLR